MTVPSIHTPPHHPHIGPQTQPAQPAPPPPTAPAVNNDHDNDAGGGSHASAGKLNIKA